MPWNRQHIHEWRLVARRIVRHTVVLRERERQHCGQTSFSAAMSPLPPQREDQIIHLRPHQLHVRQRGWFIGKGRIQCGDTIAVRAGAVHRTGKGRSLRTHGTRFTARDAEAEMRHLARGVKVHIRRRPWVRNMSCIDGRNRPIHIESAQIQAITTLPPVPASAQSPFSTAGSARRSAGSMRDVSSYRAWYELIPRLI